MDLENLNLFPINADNFLFDYLIYHNNFLDRLQRSEIFTYAHIQNPLIYNNLNELIDNLIENKNFHQLRINRQHLNMYPNLFIGSYEKKDFKDSNIKKTFVENFDGLNKFKIRQETTRYDLFELYFKKDSSFTKYRLKISFLKYNGKLLGSKYECPKSHLHLIEGNPILKEYFEETKAVLAIPNPKQLAKKLQNYI